MPYRITSECNGCGACARICPSEAVSGSKKEAHCIDGTLCIECGVCGRICPKGAVLDASGKPCTMIKRSQWHKPEFDDTLCMSCNMCIDACPVHCLALGGPKDRKDLHGHPFLKEYKVCIGCGFCADECPVDAVTMNVYPLKDDRVSVREDEKAIR